MRLENWDATAKVTLDRALLNELAILRESRDLCDLLLERYRTGSIVVTSNRRPDEWLATFADPVRAQSAIDRFTSNAYDLVIVNRIAHGSSRDSPGKQGALAMTCSSGRSRGGARRQLTVTTGAALDRRQAPVGFPSTSQEAKV
jgi:hypothetical protein